MKIYFFILLLTFFSLYTSLTNSQIKTTTPECVAYDSISNKYFVSCLMSGKIVSIDSAGNRSIFKSGLGYASGCLVYGNVLYVSIMSTKYVKGFDISTGNQVMNIQIPTAHQLDGMAVDTAGNLYIADYDYNETNDQIFKIKLSIQTYTTFVPAGHGLAGMPQGLFFDKPNNRLIVVSAAINSPIQAISLSDSVVSNILPSTVGDLDGIAMDKNGSYYITSWASQSALRYNHFFSGNPLTILSGLNGPSNLCYSSKNNTLAIPVYYFDSVIFLPVNSIGINTVNEMLYNYSLEQNYPNPFNPTTIIKYYLPESNKIVTLDVYDINGRKIKNLINQIQNKGHHEIIFDGKKLPSGIYFYKLETDEFSNVKKMLFIK